MTHLLLCSSTNWIYLEKNSNIHTWQTIFQNIRGVKISEKLCEYFEVHCGTLIINICYDRNFLKDKYLKKNKNKNRQVYHFETTATDTSLVKNIFNAITEIILNKMLIEAGFE